MIEFLYSIDKAVFIFVNQTISNPLGDVIWPLITDYDKLWAVRVVLLAMWIWLLVKGGRKGRTVALLLIPLLVVSDQLSSSMIKGIVQRARPCHEINGTAVVQGVHVLVNCGSGRSFPSSHAVNNFAVATLFSIFYRRWTWAFITWASLVAVSRVAVGVHFPSDILGGALIGTLIAALVIWVWQVIEKRYFPPRDDFDRHVITL